MQHAVILLKPDVFKRRLWGVAMEWLQHQTDIEIRDAMIVKGGPNLDAKLALHYIEHKGKPFYPGLIEFMRQGPVMAVWFTTESIGDVRDAVMRFRRSWQTDGPANLLHCSDSSNAGFNEKLIWFG